MVELPTFDFNSPGLDEMRRGSISIGVPLFNDVIQIQASEQGGKARLHVEKTRSGVEMVREDGHPIQVVFREYIDTSEHPWTIVDDLPAFKEPATELRFLKNRGDVVDLWRLDTTHVTPEDDPVAIIKFSNIVGEYALRKQQAQYRRLRWADKIRRLLVVPDFPS